MKLVFRNRTLFALAWLAALWQFLHHMQIAVLILFATRELGMSAGAIGVVYMFGGLGCVIAAASAERLSARFGIGPVIVHGLILTGARVAGVRAHRGSVWVATVLLGVAMLLFDFGGVLYGINLSGAPPGDHARPHAGPHDRDDAIPDGRDGADRIAGRRCARDRHRHAQHAFDGRRTRFAACGRRGAVVARAPPPDAARDGGRMTHARSPLPSAGASSDLRSCAR
jgi:hypothetical protein